MMPSHSRLSRRNTLLAGAALLAAPAISRAQAWPARPIRLIVPFPPGGLIDNMARLIGPKLAQEIGQPVVIDNKAGSGGNLGAGEAARAAPDGYTLLMASPPLTISPAIYKTLPYRPEQFTSVALLGRVPNVLLVKGGSDLTSVAQLSARARARPGRMNYASNGNGTSLHLSAELYKHAANLFITHIPYRGSAAALIGLIGGEVDMMFDNLPSAMGHIQAGSVRALAVTTAGRSQALPQVPTMMEAGVPDFDVSAWFGLASPAGVPPAVLARLEQALGRIARQPDVVQAMQRQGAEPGFIASGPMGTMLAADGARWKRVAAFAKITLD